MAAQPARDCGDAFALGAQCAGAALLHISTNEVFDGPRRALYREWDTVNPLRVYARSKAAAERIRAHIENTRFVIGDDQSITQTVSIGVAQWDGVELAAHLEERADQAMYAAKTLGRNRVCLSTPPTNP